MPLASGFDAASRKRIAAAVRAVEAMDPPDASTAPNRQNVTNQPEVQDVQVTNLTPVDGLYHGKIESFNSSTNVVTVFGDIWVAMANGITPKLGVSYEARRYGDKDGVAVFRVTSAVAEPIYDFYAYKDRANNPNDIDGAFQPPSGLFGNWPKLMTAEANTVYAYPIIFPAGDTGVVWGTNVVVLAVYVSAGGSAGSKCRIGLYKNHHQLPNISSFCLTPKLTSGRIFDSGDLPTTTSLAYAYGEDGTGTFVGLPPFDPGVYWLTINFNSVGTMPIVGAASTNNIMSLYGVSSGLVPTPWRLGFGLKKSQTYGAWNSANPFGDTSVCTASMITGTVDVPIPLISW